jgi:hypothetical protein
MKATTVINIASSDLLMKASLTASADHAFPVCDAVEGNPKADGSAAQMNCHLSPSQTLAQSDPFGNRHAIVTTEL